MEATDMKYYRAAGDDGGAISTDEIVSGQMNNLFPNVSASDAEAGLTTYRKFFVKNDHASDTAYNAKIGMTAWTPGDDYVAIFPGTDNDTASDFDDSTLYGVSLATSELDRGTRTITCSTDSGQDLQDLFRVGDTILFVDPGSGGKLATATIASLDNDSITINEDIPDSITLDGSRIANVLIIGDMAPGDSFAVWAKRVVPAYSRPYEDPSDYFSVTTYFDA
ncbi:MAG: hypothetical protein DRI61_04150 [Chloroflexi bacterium]|nr:MAG: hypothetical protein DRI61_04150 [Chloroflexota bacterium]